MTCPICSEKTVQRWRPFCSRRCADIDLGRWMSGSYRMPSHEDDADAQPDIRQDTEPRPN
jgi:endogenous inhibitor of DNA gyrase (YacG/DUF329 family)